MSSPVCDTRLKCLCGFSKASAAPGLGREPILLIPGKMLEFSLIHFEMRQDLLADGSPLGRILALPEAMTNTIHHRQDRNYGPKQRGRESFT